MTSPFVLHRGKVLGHYSTAAWLRNVVMALWAGTQHPVGLSKLRSIDKEHFQAFIDMTDHYRLHGEDDIGFKQLVHEIQARLESELKTEEKEKLFQSWCTDAERELRRIGKSVELVSDRYQWFWNEFDGGTTADAAALACEPLPELNER